MRKHKTCFIIDGFNLYHSLVDVKKTLGKSSPPVKWLDLHKLCKTHLSVAGRLSRLPEKAELGSVYYFSASPTHHSQDHVNRHTVYMECLKESGVSVQLGRFKKKDVFCKKCHKIFTAHEEKESDVAIAGKLFELCHSNECEIIVLITGDTDLAPAVRLCRKLFPKKVIIFGFPFKRKNSELERIAHGSFILQVDAITKCQFPNPFVFSCGLEAEMPKGW